MLKKFAGVVALVVVAAGCVPSPWGDGRVFQNAYYVSPTGNDAAAGTSAAPWQHFSKAFSVVKPGDVVVLKDGIYTESLTPPTTLNGTAAGLITIGAEHDGQALINGQGSHIPIRLRGNDYLDIEGLVAYNSSGGVVVVEANGTDNPQYNSFHRVSAYNTAATCTPDRSACNHQFWELWHADHTLIEDCVGAGRARSMAYAFQSSYTTWRRCWFRGDSGTGWSSNPSDHGGYTSYQSTHTVFENNIVADPIPGALGLAYGAHDWNNVYGGPNSQVNIDNRYFGNVLGSVAQNAMGTGATQCKMSRDHVWDNNVIVQSQKLSGAWRRGFVDRVGKNLQLRHFTMIGDSATSTGTEQQGMWVNASVKSDQDSDCSPNGGVNSGAWGYYPDTSGGTPKQHSGFDFTTTLKNSVIQGFRVGFEAETNDATSPVLTNHNNNIQGNGTNYLGSAKADPTNTSVVLNWNTAKYGKGAYFMGASNAPIGDDGQPVGAHVLYRSTDGAVTNSPLWPFPMEDRIWNETGDTRLWEGANATLFKAYRQSATWDGATINGVVRTGGWWKTLDGVYP